MSHDFHFVLRIELKKSIKGFAKSKNMSLSEAVVYIFNFMKPVLEKYYLKDASCKDGKYLCFDAEVDMHVYFDKTDYKYLKQIQSNLYCFSMALVLRFALNAFFDGIKKFGFKRFCDVVGRFGKFFLDENFKNNLLGINKRHMFSCIRGFSKICHIFDSEYNLIKTTFT